MNIQRKLHLSRYAIPLSLTVIMLACGGDKTTAPPIDDGEVPLDAFTQINPPAGGANIRILAINNQGVATIQGEAEGFDVVYVWTKADGLVALKPFTGRNPQFHGVVNAINANGAVVGAVGPGKTLAEQFEYRAAVWDSPNAAPRNLGALGENETSYGNAINTAGAVAGYGSSPTTHQNVATVIF